MKSFITSIDIAILAVVVSLTGCGGGGGAAAVAVSTGPVATTLSFPLQSADKVATLSASTKTFTIVASTTDTTTLPQPFTVTCNGTGTDVTTAATTPTTFEAKSAVSSTNTMTIAFAPCFAVNLPPAILAAIQKKLTAWSVSATTTSYFDLNYVALGSSTTGQYGVFLTPPIIPASVQVGASGIYGTETLYTDSTKATPNGRADMTYSIEPDTANTAIVNVTAKVYDAAGALLQTQQSRARITAAGGVTPVSIDVLDTAVPPTHLVWTYN